MVCNKILIYSRLLVRGQGSGSENGNKSECECV